MTMSTIRPGTMVYTSDGAELGKVAEVRGSSFRVDVSMMPDYWLPISAVSDTDGAGVRLSYGKDHIEDYKISAPAA
jgi:hypothetical protein